MKNKFQNSETSMFLAYFQLSGLADYSEFLTEF
jgi:hypothetical protein